MGEKKTLWEKTLLVKNWQGIFMPGNGLAAYKTAFLYADNSFQYAEKSGGNHAD